MDFEKILWDHLEKVNYIFTISMCSSRSLYINSHNQYFLNFWCLEVLQILHLSPYCFLLRTFFKLVDDYFIERITASGSPKFNDYSELSDSIDENSRPVNDALYVQIVVTITVLGNILPPTLFVVWEMRLLEALLLSRSHFLCGIIIDCWGCVARSLNPIELDNQIRFLIDLVRISFDTYFQWKLIIDAVSMGLSTAFTSSN